MEINLNTKELVEVTEKSTGNKKFLYLKDGEWITITKEQYNNIIEGEKNGL